MTTEQINSFFLPGGILDDDDDDEDDKDINNTNNNRRMMELSSKGRSIRPPPGFVTSGISSTGTTSSSSTIKTSRIGIEPCSSSTKFYDMKTNTTNSKAAAALLAPIGAGRMTLHPHYHPLFATTYHPNHTTTTTTTTTTTRTGTHIMAPDDGHAGSSAGRTNQCDDPLGGIELTSYLAPPLSTPHSELKAFHHGPNTVLTPPPPPPPGFSLSQELHYQHRHRQIPEEEEEEEEDNDQIHHPTIQPSNSTIPRNVIVNKDDEVSVVSFLSDHTTSTTNTSHKPQVQQPQSSLNKNISAPPNNSQNPFKSSATSSATATILRKNNILESQQQQPHAGQTSSDASQPTHPDSGTKKKKKKKKKKKPSTNNLQPEATNLLSDDVADPTSIVEQPRHVDGYSGSTSSSSPTETPLRDHAISENSSISTTPKSPQGKYPNKGYKTTNPNTKPRSSNKHNRDSTSRKAKLTTRPLPKESQHSLPSAIVSFLRSFAQCTYQIARQRIATAANRDKILFFIQRTFSILQTILVHIAQFVLHTVETLIKFLVLLHKLAVEEVLANQDGFFCYTFCTSYPQIISYITSSASLFTPRWLPQLAWIFAVSIFCYRGKKAAVIPPASSSSHLQNFQGEQDHISSARNKNNRNKSVILRNHNANHMVLQRNRETEQILLRLVRGEKVSKANVAKLSFSNSSDLSSNNNNNSAPEESSIDLATADKLSCALSAAFPEFVDAEEADYFIRSLCYFSNTFSKFSYDLLRTSWIILIILLSLETVTNDSSSIIMELSGSEQVLLGYSLAVIKMGYISSPIAWISLSLQVFIVTFFNNFGQHVFFLDHFLLVIGLATLHLVQKIADRRAVFILEDGELHRQTSSNTDPIDFVHMTSATSSHPPNDTKVDLMALFQVIAILGMELSKLLLPDTVEKQ